MSFFKIFSKTKSDKKIFEGSVKISESIKKIFSSKKLDEAALMELEEILLLSDMGYDCVESILKNIKEKKFEKNISDFELLELLAKEVEVILKPCEKELKLDYQKKPQVLVFNGVNGSGKTTTIAKIAQNLKNQNKKILIAACDTFRAAAFEQLEFWANKIGCEIIKPQKEAEDPAAVAYRALDYAVKNDFDILLIDTAGRLQNKQNLMDELKKINSVLKKIDASAPQENLLIIDARTGQNAKSQLEIFNQIIGITGLIITKLDGTAKGGAVVSLAKTFSTPIYAISVGELPDDLQEFSAENFSKNLVGISDFYQGH